MHPDTDVLLRLSLYVGAAGVMFYLLILAWVIVSARVPPARLIRLGKMIAWIMILMPVCLRWFLSQYAVLWSALAISAIGMGIKIRNWLGA